MPKENRALVRGINMVSATAADAGRPSRAASSQGGAVHVSNSPSPIPRRQADPRRLQTLDDGRRSAFAKTHRGGDRWLRLKPDKAAARRRQGAACRRPPKATASAEKVAAKGAATRRQRRPREGASRERRRLRAAHEVQYRRRIRRADEQFGYKNEMQIPQLDKIVVNMGIGEAVDDSKKADVGRRTTWRDHRPEADADQGAQVDRRLQAARGHGDRRQGHACARTACTSSSTA